MITTIIGKELCKFIQYTGYIFWSIHIVQVRKWIMCTDKPTFCEIANPILKAVIEILLTVFIRNKATKNDGSILCLFFAR